MTAVRDLVEGRPADAERQSSALQPELEARFEANEKAGKVTPGFKPHFPAVELHDGHRARESRARTDEALEF